MSNRANSSARNRRAGPSTNIQETLTTNPQTLNSSNNYNPVKEEPKLMTITQAFVLINGKIRNLENQVENLKKYGVASSDSVSTQNAVRAEDELSDVSEFKPSSNLEEDFYNDNTQNNINSDNMRNTTLPESHLTQENLMNTDKVNQLVNDATKNISSDIENKVDNKVSEIIENLNKESDSTKSQILQIKETSDELTSKLNSIEQLITNIQELNTKLPEFMSSVENRFSSLESNSSELNDKVNNVLLKYNDKLDGVQERMIGLQDYAVNLHSLFIKRFDEHVDSNYESKELKEKLESMKEKQVVFNTNQNEQILVENYINNGDDEESKEEEEEEALQE